ncbi:MAG: hypothetical protein ACTSRU_17995, partial [Candidatus Hodarchaeales archaeon]
MELNDPISKVILIDGSIVKVATHKLNRGHEGTIIQRIERKLDGALEKISPAARYKKDLGKIFERVRKGMKLQGHGKVHGKARCLCGVEMYHSDSKSGFVWRCPVEDKEWKYIHEKLGVEGFEIG